MCCALLRCQTKVCAGVFVFNSVLAVNHKSMLVFSLLFSCLFFFSSGSHNFADFYFHCSSSSTPSPHEGVTEMRTEHGQHIMERKSVKEVKYRETSGEHYDSLRDDRNRQSRRHTLLQDVA